MTVLSVYLPDSPFISLHNIHFCGLGYWNLMDLIISLPWCCAQSRLSKSENSSPRLATSSITHPFLGTDYNLDPISPFKIVICKRNDFHKV